MLEPDQVLKVTSMVVIDIRRSFVKAQREVLRIYRFGLKKMSFMYPIYLNSPNCGHAASTLPKRGLTGIVQPLDDNIDEKAHVLHA